MELLPRDLKVNCPTVSDFNETGGGLMEACQGALAERIPGEVRGNADVLEE